MPGDNAGRAFLDVLADRLPDRAAHGLAIEGAYVGRPVFGHRAPVGFIMLFDPRLPGAAPKPGVAADEVLLWRFMVDRHFQGRGFDRKALDLVRDTVRGRPDLRRIIASYVPGPHGPESFYLDYGFAKTGRLCHEGREIEISISP